MVWAAIGAAAVGVVGGAINAKSGKQAAQTSAGMSQADRDFYNQTYQQSLGDNRATQTNDFGTQGWTKGPDGKWTQENKLNPAEAARLEDYRQVAADRMADAKAGYHTDWNSLGFGKLNAAVHGVPGDTGRVHGTGVGGNYMPGQQTSAFPSAGGNILHSGTQIAPNYQPGSQFMPPPAPPSAEPPPPGSDGKVTIDPIQQAQADALRKQQEQGGWQGGS
jgi:hypothetical protein